MLKDLLKSSWLKFRRVDEEVFLVPWWSTMEQWNTMFDIPDFNCPKNRELYAKTPAWVCWVKNANATSALCCHPFELLGRHVPNMNDCVQKDLGREG